MQKFEYTITDPDGIHARPAGLLVKEAKTFSSDIQVQANGKTGDCKKLFALMALGAKQGTEIVITANGADEDAAIAALSAFLQANL